MLGPYMCKAFRYIGFVFIVLVLSGQFVLAAENLSLREGISFVQDIDSGFPLVGEKMDDLSIEPGRPTLIFFGAAGDLNSNRQAKRVVDLYRDYRQSRLKFLVVDVDQSPHTNASKSLIKNFYKGYIPQEVLLDKDGKVVFSHVGEIDNKQVSSQINKLL